MNFYDSMRNWIFFISLSLWLLSCNNDIQTTNEQTSQVDSLQVDYVWSGHFVGFDLITDPPYQYIAYYDSSRRMTIAQRKLEAWAWQKVHLPETTVWDSHNYIAMAVDQKGVLHISGNMHGDSLVYFMSGAPHDITSFYRVKKLIGDQEDEVTYPQFFESHEGDLIFQYRIGSSGKGNQIFNRYKPGTKEWSRLIDEPLVDGKGKMNAYLHGPILGPDGFYHLIWVWRDTPDAATNHDLSYAKSKNLVDWYKSNGDSQPIPITYENAEIIDPVPAGGGMINGNTKIGFDKQSRPVVSYHKFDAAGNTQLYNARIEKNAWKIYKSTSWGFRWDFGGYGSLDSRVGVQPVIVEGDQLTQKYFIDTVGVQKILLDPSTLKEQKKLPDERNPYFQVLEKVKSPFEGMEVHLKTDQQNEQETYVLRWETLPPHKDQPLQGKIPDPQPLKLFHLRTE